VSADPSTLLEDAHTIVGELLAQLRVLAEKAQQHDAELTQQARQRARELDEVTAQHRFAAENHLPTAEKLAHREQEVRAAYAALNRDSQASRHALKQLDLLMRQIDMSSTSLHGTPETEATDPWVLALRSQVILGREEERVRLAREVHDGPAQVLANTLMVAEQSRSLLQDQRIDQLGLMLDRLCSATREGLYEVRRFIADLRPGRISEQGLIPALQEYIQRYQETRGAPVTFEADAPPPMTKETEIVLYRVVQEALQNAHKHAPGATISITLAIRGTHMVLTIRDDGPGFDPRDVARRAGRESWGLTSMRERAEMIGARLMISSRPGHGTEVSLALPLAQAL
jgi:two-component system sensor histidine kinase DegS